MKYFCLEGNQFRDPTPEELAAANALINERKILYDSIVQSHARLDQIAADCKHEVFYDVPGHPYDVRYCAVCRKSELI